MERTLIRTRSIPAGFLDLTEPDQIGKHALERADPNFVKEVQPGDLIVASTNFGCGSSREHAAVTLKSAGVWSYFGGFVRTYFYRNVINLGVPLIVCPGISKIVKRGDILTVDMTTGKVLNETTGASADHTPYRHTLEFELSTSRVGRAQRSPATQGRGDRSPHVPETG